MKLNSRFAYILSALLLLAIVISSASAAGNGLINGDFADDFKLSVPSGSDFDQTAVTDLNFSDGGFKILVFENLVENSKDASTIIYVADGTNDSSIVSGVITDLKNDYELLEDNGNSMVFKSKQSNNGFGLNIGDTTEDIWNSVSDVFSSFADSSSDNGISVSDGKNNNVSLSADGIQVSDSEGADVSLSTGGFEVSDANGQNVSLSPNGIKVSSSSSDNISDELVDANVSWNGNMDLTNIDCDYIVAVQNKNTDKVILLAGNDLDLLKTMAETVSFK